jgi:hypothetical protein
VRDSGANPGPILPIDGEQTAEDRQVLNVRAPAVLGQARADRGRRERRQVCKSAALDQKRADGRVRALWTTAPMPGAPEVSVEK